MQKTWRGATYWFALYCLFSLHPAHQPTNGPTHDGEYMGGNLLIEAKLMNTQTVCALKSLKYIKIHSVNLTDNVHRQGLPLPCGLPRSLVFECCPLGMWMGMCVTTVCIWRSEDHFQSEFLPFTILALGSGLRLGDGASMRWAKYHSWGIVFTSTVSTSLPNSCHSTLKISQLPVSFLASLTAPSSALSRCCLEC